MGPYWLIAAWFGQIGLLHRTSWKWQGGVLGGKNITVWLSPCPLRSGALLSKLLSSVITPFSWPKQGVHWALRRLALKEKKLHFFSAGGDAISGGGRDCSPECKNQPDHGRRRQKYYPRGPQEALPPAPTHRIDRGQSPEQVDMLLEGGWECQ